MKSLVGEWDATASSGQPVHVSYRLISNGTALMETQTADESEMVTIYNPDGEQVLLTHYCSHGNEPRMRAKVAPGEVEKLDFRLVDVANLSSPKALHRNRLVVTFQDSRHFTQEWTSVENGRSGTEIFRFARAK